MPKWSRDKSDLQPYLLRKLVSGLFCTCFRWFVQVRCYPRSCKLDNTFAQVCKVPSPVLLLNTFRDSLIIFCADSHVLIFCLERKNTQPSKL